MTMRPQSPGIPVEGVLLQVWRSHMNETSDCAFRARVSGLSPSGERISVSMNEMGWNLNSGPAIEFILPGPSLDTIHV